jgi:plasmid stability protein
VHAAIHSPAAPLDEGAGTAPLRIRIQSARHSKSTRVEAPEVRTAEELLEETPPPPQHHAAIPSPAQIHAAEGIIRKPHLLSYNAPGLWAVGRRFLPKCDFPTPTSHSRMVATVASCAARGLF